MLSTCFVKCSGRTNHANTDIPSGTHWESMIGYSRVVRVGDFVFVSGTTAINKEGKIIGIGNHIYRLFRL